MAAPSTTTNDSWTSEKLETDMDRIELSVLEQVTLEDPITPAQNTPHGCLRQSAFYHCDNSSSSILPDENGDDHQGELMRDMRDTIDYLELEMEEARKQSEENLSLLLEGESRIRSLEVENKALLKVKGDLGDILARREQQLIRLSIYLAQYHGVRYRLQSLLKLTYIFERTVPN